MHSCFLSPATSTQPLALYHRLSAVPPISSLSPSFPAALRFFPSDGASAQVATARDLTRTDLLVLHATPESTRDVTTSSSSRRRPAYEEKEKEGQEYAFEHHADLLAGRVGWGLLVHLASLPSTRLASGVRSP